MIKKITLLVLVVLTSQLTLSQTHLNDVSLSNLNLPKYALTSNGETLSLEVKNNGSTTIHSLDVNWNDGENNHTATINTNILAGKTAVISHPVPVNYKGVVEKKITAQVLKINGEASPITENTASRAFNTVARKAKKAVLFERLTGTWNSFCPKGIVGYKKMEQKYPNKFIGVAVHTSQGGDPMGYRSYQNKMGLRGLPSCNVDRKQKNVFFNNGSNINGKLENALRKQLKEEAPADLTGWVFSTSESNNIIKIHAGALFLSSFSSSNFRLGVIVTEDGVTGTSRGYKQANSYSGGRFGKMGGFENLPNPVPARDMVYDNVARALIGGYDGQVNSVPSRIKNGQAVWYEFDYDVSSRYNKDNLNFILVLIDANDGSIVNAKKLTSFIHSGTQTMGVEKLASSAQVRVYPNPVTDILNIAFEAETANYNVAISDVLGRVVLSKAYSLEKGRQNVQLPVSNLKSGHYLVSIANNKGSFSKQIVIE